MLPLSVSYIHQVCLCFTVCIIPPAPTPSARAEAAGLRLQASALGLRRTISYLSGPSTRHVFLQSDIMLYIKRSARGASRFALCAMRPALCACRAARHRRNPPETEETIRGHAIPQQGPVSYHTPQKSPPSQLGHSYRTQPRPPRSSKTVAQSLGNLSDEERVHTGNVLDDLCVFDRATTVCVARHPIVHAVVSPC
mgnify:CR=1 FL=1